MSLLPGIQCDSVACIAANEQFNSLLKELDKFVKYAFLAEKDVLRSLSMLYTLVKRGVRTLMEERCAILQSEILIRLKINYLRLSE